MDIREVAVIGLGTMGAGIAEVLARGGLQVVAVEADPEALRRGMSILQRSLDRAVSRGKLTSDEQAAIAGRVRPAGGFDEAAGADLAIEAVPERMEIKRQVFAELDRVCRPEAILATNTSSLSVTEIAAGTQHPGRVAGLHFFNPAPVMRLVEVVGTVLTEEAVLTAAAGLAARLGKTCVRVSDRAGFVANALLLPYLNHAVTLLETRFATREDIDTAATAGIGLPMGPLALLDLIGLDTSLSILEVLHGELGGPRYQPAPLLRRLVAAGRTGRKSGRGLYDYGSAGPPPATATSEMPDEAAGAGPAVITLTGPGAGPGSELAAAAEAAGVTVRTDPAQPSDLVLIAASPAAPVLAAALAAGRPAETVGLHLAGPPGARLAELVPTRLTSPAAAAAAAALAARLGLRAVHAPDRPGFLTGTLLYPHLADAVRMVQDGYASAADVDTAMTLGCGYPRGPLDLLDQAGPAAVLEVLQAMHLVYGAPAVAAPPLLAEHAAAGLPFRG
ncbi:MAG TPA: 3-hydroxybutyryl-CoA dehydrogenase [Streptosporangiaceae bacterium]|nr:3-hydroxybutyryl-CoA dehydrogenase [Streptosporangiaceae bacterium]